jgi:ComF family protein
MKTSFWTKLFDLISPRLCCVCGSRLTVGEAAICSHCLLHLPRTYYWKSPLDNPMARLYWGLVPIEKAVALFFYEPKSELSQLIYDLKYHNRPDIGTDMGRIAAKEFQLNGLFDDIDALVPVPLTRRRRWQRGYNQSMEIARGVSQATGLPIYNKVVARRHFTESQTHKGFWQRHDNVENAFELTDASLLKGKHLLVVDDIVTTGSTTMACMEAISKAGDVKLSVMALGFSKS